MITRTFMGNYLSIFEKFFDKTKLLLKILDKYQQDTKF